MMRPKRRRRGDSIDLDELKELREAYPDKSWVNLFLLNMYHNSIGAYTLEKAKGIPPIPREEELPAGELSFEGIINRLKVMSELDPVKFKKPRNGSFSLTIRGDSYTVNTTFVDDNDNPTCSITMSRANA